MILALFPAFVRHTPSFCSASLFCFKGENKGEKLGLIPAALPLSWALLRPVCGRRGRGDQMQPGGAAVALGAPVVCVRPRGRGHIRDSPAALPSLWALLWPVSGRRGRGHIRDSPAALSLSWALLWPMCGCRGRGDQMQPGGAAAVLGAAV